MAYYAPRHRRSAALPSLDDGPTASSLRRLAEHPVSATLATAEDRGLRPVVVEAHGLTAGYGGTPAIHDIDLEVRAGEVVALLGANGAGKTTTLLTLAGEVTPIAGSVVFHGDARRRRLHQRARKGLGFLTEERCVFMQLTGWQNLKLGRGRPEGALEFFPELEEHLGKKVGLLSGGQQQMLALGRVLAAEPRVLLADELSLGLAPMVVERLLTAVRAAADAGVAVILVEQHVRQALAVADRVHVLRRGRVVLSGSADDLRGDADGIAAHYLTGEA
jgi:branched-chain amino acid transport system ATP-binding protein